MSENLKDKKLVSLDGLGHFYDNLKEKELSKYLHSDNFNFENEEKIETMFKELETEYLKIEALTDGVEIRFSRELEYSYDKITWNVLSANSPIFPLKAHEFVYLKGELSPNTSGAGGPAVAYGIGNFTVNGTFSVSGNPKSILKDNTLVKYGLGQLFYNCTNLVDASGLILNDTTLPEGCYVRMFHDCSNLIKGPELPATTLSKYCYLLMFYGCSNLTEIKCHANIISADSCLGSWVTGVSSTGNFYCVNGVSYPNGEDGIPEGWTRFNIDDLDLDTSIKEIISLTDLELFWEKAKTYITSIENSLKSNIDDEINKKINLLDVEDTAVEGQYVSSVSETDGKISVTRTALPTLSDLGGITSADVDNKIGARSIKNDTGEVTEQATGVYIDIEKIENDINSLTGGNGSIADQISSAIGEINYSDTEVNGQYVSSIYQEKGIISVTRTALPTLNDLGGITSTDVDNKVKASIEALDVEDTAIEGQYVSSVSQVDGKITVTRAALPAQKEYSIASITGDELTNLGANVKEAYKLVVDGVQTGDTIKIYKDSSLKEYKLEGQELVFTYILADGTEKTEKIDVSTFLAESEFKNGLEVDTNNGTVAVKIDTTSETFLTVSENGVKLSGVQTAINTAISELANNAVKDNTDAITVLNGDGDGSVVKAKSEAIDAAKSYTDTKLAEITLATDAEINALFA